jgi:hypothetical protein
MLHNYRSQHCGVQYTPSTAVGAEDLNTGEIIEGDWRIDSNPLRLRVLHSFVGNAPLDAKTVRNRYALYFENAGQVPW